VPGEVRDAMTFHLVESASEAVNLALEEALTAHAASR
jgi:hypothetical protein